MDVKIASYECRLFNKLENLVLNFFLLEFRSKTSFFANFLLIFSNNC